MNSTEAPVSDIDPFSIEFLRDPIPYYDEMHKLGPVLFLPQYGCYLLNAYDEVASVFKNWKVFSSGYAGTGLIHHRHEEPDIYPQNIFLESDPPTHTMFREVIGTSMENAFSPTMREDCQAEADRIIGDVLKKPGPIDGVVDIAEAFHLKIIGDLLGLEPEGREQLVPLTNSAFNEFGAITELVEKSRTELMGPASWALGQSLQDVLTPGSIGAGLYEHADKGVLTETDAGIVLRVLMTGSFNVIYLIAGLLHEFAENPEQWNLLLQNPKNYALRSQAGDEAMRTWSPLQRIFRTTTEDVEVAGIQIPADTKVQLGLGAANRDPNRWPDPNTFDLQRDYRRHLSYGVGVHDCMGEHLVRMEVDAVLEALIKHGKTIEPAGEPEYRINNLLRGLAHLPLSFGTYVADDTAPIKLAETTKPATDTNQAGPGCPFSGNGDQPETTTSSSESLSKEEKNIALVATAQRKLIVDADADSVDEYWSTDYIQHNPRIPSGSAILKRFFTMLRPADLRYKHGLFIAEGDYVAHSSTVEGFLGKPKQALLDIFRISDGLIVEHWDVLQEVPLDGPSPFPIPAVEPIPGVNDMNREVVTKAVHQLFVDRDLSAIEEFWAPDHVEHGGQGAEGRDGLRSYVSGLGDSFTMEIGLTMVYGQFVLTHSRFTVPEGQPEILGDIYRVADGRIVEHWDLRQAEVPQNRAVSGNAMFPIVSYAGSTSSR